MKLEELRYGMKVREKNTKFEFIVVAFGGGLHGENPWVYCDFEENEGDVWEYEPEDLEPIEE